MSQAVDQLLDRTLASLAGPLNELERTELSELMRVAIAADPTLRGLQSDQG